MNTNKIILSVLLLTFFKIGFCQNDFKITIARKLSTNNCTMGYLSVNGETICYTLELPWEDNSNNISCVPAGTYDGILRYDKSDGWRIQLEDVPNRTAVQIHIGNYTSDIKGCVLLGTNANTGNCTVQNSVAAYSKLKNKFYGTDTPVSSPNYKITVTFIE